MKIYISADIEGTTGIAHWSETEKSKPDYDYFSKQMTAEVKAACEGALKAGTEEILIKDAHDSARNLNPSELPENIKIIRGWSRHPFMMMQEIDASFDAAIMTGYHSYAGSGDNPLAHTMDNENINYVKINGEWASEFVINAYTAAMFNVPVVFVSGDEGLCNHVKKFNSNITTLPVNKGTGNSSISIHPKVAVERIKKEVEEALRKDVSKCKIQLPESFEVEICYNQHFKAYSASFYPGMKQVNPKTVLFQAKDYMDVLNMMHFVL